jgi:hypothetical protein
MLLTGGICRRHLFQMTDKLAKITPPIQFHKVDTKDVVAAIWTGCVSLRPMVKAICANDAVATRENHRIFAQIKAK